jgi:hypothetical protein
MVSEAKLLEALAEARQQLIWVGGQDMPVGYDEVEDALNTFELALHRYVMSQSGIGGNSSHYTLARIKELEEK